MSLNNRTWEDVIENSRRRDTIIRELGKLGIPCINFYEDGILELESLLLVEEELSK